MGSRGNRRDDGKFLTDTDISRVAGPNERRLEAWVDTSGPDEHVERVIRDTNSGKWDQFAANRQKFGIVPTYNESLYTTEIDKSHPEFAARERRAAQLAREIETKSYSGDADDGAGDEVDEEDMFSGVQRTHAPNKVQEFAAREAQAAMASPAYLADQERAERQADQAKLAGKMSQLSTDTKGEPASKNENKKKFNFAAAAARTPSFKRPSGSSVSPGPTFQPTGGPGGPGGQPPAPVSPVNMATPPVMGFPGMAPGMGSPMGMPGPIPAGMPFMPPPGMPMPGPPPAPEIVRDTKPVDVSNLRSIAPGDFDFIAQTEKKEEPLPKIFFTPPNWTPPGDPVGTEFYVDQFPSTTQPRMQMMMPPVVMMPQF